MSKKCHLRPLVLPHKVRLLLKSSSTPKRMAGWGSRLLSSVWPSAAGSKLDSSPTSLDNTLECGKDLQVGSCEQCVPVKKRKLMPATSLSFRQVEPAPIPTDCDCSKRLAATDRKVLECLVRLKGLDKKIEHNCDTGKVASQIQDLERRTQYLEERLVETYFHLNKLADLERKMADLEVSPVSRKKSPFRI